MLALSTDSVVLIVAAGFARVAESRKEVRVDTLVALGILFLGMAIVPVTVMKFRRNFRPLLQACTSVCVGPLVLTLSLVRLSFSSLFLLARGPMHASLRSSTTDRLSSVVKTRNEDTEFIEEGSAL